MNHVALNMRLAKGKQSGFTIVELLVVIAIVTILGIVGIFAIGPTIVSGKVQPAATELLRGMQKMRINAEGAGLTPYTTATTSVFANQMRGGNTFTVTGVGTGATIRHGLTAFGAGAVTVAPAALTTAGDAYAVTLAGMSDSACPGFAASAQKMAEVITINGTQVKAAGGNYNGAAASDACTLLDTNTFVFTSQ